LQLAHRKLTHLLNLLLAGGASVEPSRTEHFWAILSSEGGGVVCQWVQPGFFVQPDAALTNLSSVSVTERLEEVNPDVYYKDLGFDGNNLCVPTDLDRSICRYLELLPESRAKFDRATFWMSTASRQWYISVSASFAALVSGIESLTEQGNKHTFTCPICKGNGQHEVPGATRRFKDFLEMYAPGRVLKDRRDKMYGWRSDSLCAEENGEECSMSNHRPQGQGDSKETSRIIFESGLGFAMVEIVSSEGKLLGVELLGLCEIRVFDRIARKEPKGMQDVALDLRQRLEDAERLKQEDKL
jgi:hypothetical protein